MGFTSGDVMPKHAHDRKFWLGTVMDNLGKLYPIRYQMFVTKEFCGRLHLADSAFVTPVSRGPIYVE